MWYIGTYQQCTDYLNQVNSGENYGPGTLAWAAIKTSVTTPLTYCIKKHAKYGHPNMLLVENLPDQFKNIA